MGAFRRSAVLLSILPLSVHMGVHQKKHGA
uniref:Uncharacterized protein n=1 Tax=Arundo donax TaxID=35708 RepID=A0A0A9CLZ2_ARUDO